MEAKTNIELNVLYCTDNEITEDQIVLKIMNALQDGESQIVVSPANQHRDDAVATWIEPTKPQMDLIPEHHQRDLKRLAEITGHSFESLVAGYWYRYGEVQTLQIELEWRDKMIETLKPLADGEGEKVDGYYKEGFEIAEALLGTVPIGPPYNNVFLPEFTKCLTAWEKFRDKPKPLLPSAVKDWPKEWREVLKGTYPGEQKTGGLSEYEWQLEQIVDYIKEEPTLIGLGLLARVFPHPSEGQPAAQGDLLSTAKHKRDLLFDVLSSYERRIEIRAAALALIKAFDELLEVAP